MRYKRQVGKKEGRGTRRRGGEDTGYPWISFPKEIGVD